jgi:hypothetical protein
MVLSCRAGQNMCKVVMQKLESAKHQSVRSFLRVAGPLTALAGIVLIAIGFISFFAAMGGGDPPRFFWCAFLGMPLLFVGIVMCKFAFFGAVARYLAAEAAPVAKDTVNYMAKETQEGVKTVARAIGEGIREGAQNTEKPSER